VTPPPVCATTNCLCRTS